MSNLTNHDNITINNRSTYGSFLLCGEEFAIAANSIREVVNEPSEYSPLPLAPYYMLGVFNLRGIIIPVIDLRKILKLKNKNDDKTRERKISIIECGNFCIGLLFDKTREVFNDNNLKKIEYKSEEPASEQAIINGLFKLDNAKRIVQILDPLKISDINNLAKIQEHDISSLAQKRVSRRKQCISFKKDNAQCAFYINDIQEVVKVKAIENNILTGGLCLGSIDVRGDAIPVINLSEILDADTQFDEIIGNDKEFSIIIMEKDNKRFGLPVDSIENIVSYRDEEVIEIPVIAKKNRAIIEGCISTEESSNIILLNRNEILSHPQIKTILDGHYKPSLDETGNEIDNTSVDNQINSINEQKNAYITFTIGSSYALKIEDIEEVIEYPENIIRPPSSSKHCCGLLESRGEIIPLIDPAVFEIEQDNLSALSKVIIIIVDNVKCGFMVNSVDSIFSFKETDKYKIPHLVRQTEQCKIIAKTEEAFKNSNSDEETLYLLNISALSSKIDLSDVDWKDQ